MSGKTFRGSVVREENGRFMRAVEERTTADLPAGDLLIKVSYSSLNYKDALSATGHRGVTRHYPHTPGIDAAGLVEAGGTGQPDDVAPGDEVIVIGHDLGMETDGGFGQYIRVPSEWAVRRPETLSLFESMIYGTAGFTAAMCVERLLVAGVAPDQGEVLVTGATGGVGSVAVAILAQLGFRVVAATGKAAAQEAFLHRLGAQVVVGREQVQDHSGRPLLSGRWAGVVDTVGGEILATAIKATQPGGAVACCGNVAAAELHTTIFPFILRGVSLLGVESAHCARPTRRRIWEKLAGDWRIARLDELGQVVTLAGLDEHIDRILAGQEVGRVVVALWP